MRMPPPVALTGDPDERNYKSPKFTLGSLTTITQYSDFICPWCWVGFFQAIKLAKEYGLTFDWRGAELIPPSMNYTPALPKPVDPDAPPKPPSRFDLFAEAEGLTPPAPRPSFVRSHRALLAVEFARENGTNEQTVGFIESVYRAFWERREDISDIDVLSGLAGQSGLDREAFVASIESEQFVDNILPFDDDAYTIGIRHVPTFLFGAEELLAEAPYRSLAAAAESFLVRQERHKGKK